MDVVEHIDSLANEGELLALAATDVDPDAPVRVVPDLSLRELVHHVGGIHRWATTTIREARTERYDTSLLEVVGEWPADTELVDWFRAGHTTLLQTLRDADPDLECWSFFAAPTPVAFWARRQAHETAIHRADAQERERPDHATRTRARSRRHRRDPLRLRGAPGSLPGVRSAAGPPARHRHRPGVVGPARTRADHRARRRGDPGGGYQ